MRLDTDSDLKVERTIHRKILSDAMRASVRAFLLKRAKGTFLWVDFVIEEPRRREEVEDTLNRLPGLLINPLNSTGGID
jgi:hypothetical protein